MTDDAILFPEYTYISISGNSYCPFFKNGKWYVVNGSNVCSLLEIVLLCNIPDDEATFLKLRYGG